MRRRVAQNKRRFRAFLKNARFDRPHTAAALLERHGVSAQRLFTGHDGECARRRFPVSGIHERAVVGKTYARGVSQRSGFAVGAKTIGDIARSRIRPLAVKSIGPCERIFALKVDYAVLPRVSDAAVEKFGILLRGAGEISYRKTRLRSPRSSLINVDNRSGIAGGSPLKCKKSFATSDKSTAGGNRKISSRRKNES